MHMKSPLHIPVLRSLLVLMLIAGALAVQAQRQYAGQSVLADGAWYKLAITQTGIYRLEPNFLSALGINTASLDPRNIRIYGNGGGMLPQDNTVPRHDDLVENAIWVRGEEDGVFSLGDFVAFYAEGPHVWQYDANKDAFTHSQHLYSDTNFYYLHIATAPGKRISAAGSAGATWQANQTRNSYFYEREVSNLIRSGRNWAGERFDLTLSRSFSFHLPDMQPNGQIRLRVRVAARSDVSTSFDVRAGATVAGSISISSVNVLSNEGIHHRYRTGEFVLPASVLSGDSLRVILDYKKNGSNASEAWLDWIEVDYDQRPDLRNADQMSFCLRPEGGAAAQVSLANGNNTYQLWDVTNPVAVQSLPYTVEGSNLRFEAPAAPWRRIVAFRSGFRVPAAARRIPNQNLHGEDAPDYLIITVPAFMNAASQLAAFHELQYNRTVKILTPEQVYNEFSSGKQDVSAIRDYLKMHYDRSGKTKPGFVLLFGDGSYDYKSITHKEGNFVPTYQSRNSESTTRSYASDDFFGMLDDDEGFWGEGAGSGEAFQSHKLDVAIGRLPVATAAEAQAMVDKIVAYVTSPEGLGDWRSRVTFVADHKESDLNLHATQADSHSGLIAQADACYNIEKIYMDNYPVERTAGGIRFPQGRQALLDQFDRGALIVNYTGHGGEYAWSNSAILENADIQNMRNAHRLPAVVTATCEFGRFDEPDLRSGAELFVLRPDGGAIALFTTVRLVYSAPNATLNANFYREIFKYDADKGRMPTVGEVMMRTKNRTFSPTVQDVDINSRNFTLLGDPGLILAYPGLKAVVQEINGRPVEAQRADTLRSRARIRVKGIITDDEGMHQADYNGMMNVTIFDKPSRYTTRLSPFPFYWQNNRIFSGNSTVQNGAFEFEFVVPIDISYEDGKGKISLYVQDGVRDGQGCYNNLYIGGTETAAVPDDEGPLAKVYVYDEKWVDGGITDPSPVIFARFFDESGINTVASGIGHEIIGFLDGDDRNVFILNEYYRAKLDDFREGTLSYQLHNLSEGEHTFTIRVWDAANNFSEASTRFVVKSNSQPEIRAFLAYPNPVASGAQVNFAFSMNQPRSDQQAVLRIIAPDGRLLRVLSDNIRLEGPSYNGLSWDGTNMEGRPVAPGIYIGQLTLSNADSRQTAASSVKFVIKP